MKKKIYIYHPYSGSGGADLSLSRLINGLSEKKYEVEFLSLNFPIIKKKIFRKIKYTRIPSSRTIFSFLFIKNILVNDKSKKIFISNQYFVNCLVIFFLRSVDNLKIILFERNHLDELSTYSDVKDFIKKQIIKNLIKIYYRKADLVIGNSKELSKDLSKFIKKKVYTIYNPCFFKFKKNYNNKLKIINVGRLVDQKDQITILKAYSICKFKKNIELIIYGNGEQYKELNNYIVNHGLINARIIKNEYNHDKIYQEASLFILSSKYEGFPNVLVEAASYRIPIVSSNFKSGAKEILLNGKGGTFFPRGDYVSLAKIIDNFYHSKKLFLYKEINCAQKLYRFSYKNNIKKFLDCIDSV